MMILWFYLAINVGLTVYHKGQLEDICLGASVVRTFFITVSWLLLIGPYIAYDKLSRFIK